MNNLCMSCRAVQGGLKHILTSRPSIQELTGRPESAMGTIARNMLLEAERVYTDLQDMQALFPKDLVTVKTEPVEHVRPISNPFLILKV